MRSARSRRTKRRASRVLGVLTLIPTFGLLLTTSAYADLTTASGGLNHSEWQRLRRASQRHYAVRRPQLGADTHHHRLSRRHQLARQRERSRTATERITDRQVERHGRLRIDHLVNASEPVSYRLDWTRDGSATVGTVTVGGRPVSVNTAPNTTLILPGSGTATFNEQITGATSIKVNAVHIHLTGILGNGDIIIAQSMCSATASGVQVPAGAFGGVLLTGFVALAFGGYQLTSSRLRRRTVMSQ